jgi:hypothetical protein
MGETILQNLRTLSKRYPWQVAEAILVTLGERPVSEAGSKSKAKPVIKVSALRAIVTSLGKGLELPEGALAKLKRGKYRFEKVRRSLGTGINTFKSIGQ